jgi:hypothetical protein
MAVQREFWRRPVFSSVAIFPIEIDFYSADLDLLNNYFHFCHPVFSEPRIRRKAD